MHSGLISSQTIDLGMPHSPLHLASESGRSTLAGYPPSQKVSTPVWPSNADCRLAWTDHRLGNRKYHAAANQPESLGKKERA